MMRLFEQIRNWGHQYFLEKALKQSSHLPQAINYSKAYYIGILYDASEPENIVVANQYAARLKGMGKKVELTGLFKNKKQVGENTFSHFTMQDVNFFHIPGSEFSALANKPFDLLVSLHTETSLPLEYISALSKAKCRVGRYIKDKTWCYDLMVNAPQGSTLKEMVRQTDYLLTEINKNATV